MIPTRRSYSRAFIALALTALGAMAPVASAQSFTQLVTAFAEPPNPVVAWGDYDGDGDLDLLIAGSGRHDVAFTTLYRNDGGAFVDSGIAILGLAGGAAAWGDFDGDGDLDLALSGVTSAQAPTTRVFRNDAGAFVAVSSSFLGVLGGSMAWADVDGDGDLDLLVTGVTSTAAGSGVGATRLYRNDAGTFVSVSHPFPNCYLGGISWGDYDGDSRPDLAIAGTSAQNVLFASIFHNDGGGAFTDMGANLPPDELGPVVWGDYDHDGDLDLLLGGNSYGNVINRVYRNDGGTFTDISAGLLPMMWAHGGWGDYDDDGDLDLVVTGYDPVVQVKRSILYRNDDGTFVDSGVALRNLYLGGAGWADIDNDGDLDLLLAGNGDGQDQVVLYRNNSAIANTAPSAPTGLSASVAGSDALLSWDAASDDHTAPAGLSYNLRLGTSPGGSQVVSGQSGIAGMRALPAFGNTFSTRFARVSGLVPGTTYYWSVQAVDASLRGSPFATEVSFTFGNVDLGVGDGIVAGPLLWASPNPFSGTTTLRLGIGAAGDAQLQVFDTNGRLARHAWEGHLSGGQISVAWDGRDDAGRVLPAGIYLYRLEGASFSARGRLVKLN